MLCRSSKFLGVLVFTLGLSIAISGQTKAIPTPFNPPRLVNDYISLLKSSEYQRLENKLVAYNDSTSIQIAVVLEETSGGEDIVTYAQRLAENWGIGQGDSDNGILLLVTMKDRGLRIHTGYGAEIFLTDAMSKRIITRVIAPNFKSGDYYRGIDKATDIMMQLGTGEYQAVSSERRSEGIPPELIFILFIVIIIVISVIKNKDRWDDGDDGGYYRGGRYEDYGRPRRKRSRGWVVMPGSSGGFGSSGGGFGGGFGGFGGGSFGGGGASGSW